MLERNSSRLLRPVLSSLLCLAFGLTLAGCASDDDDDETPKTPLTAEEYYNKGLDLLDQGEYTESAKSFEGLDREYPYSSWDARAQINAAYAYYQAEKYDDAITTLDRFIQLHPGHERVDYAYYLRALCIYEQINDTKRDQSHTFDARAALNEVVTRFPASIYARDARVKLDFITNHLAGGDMEVGRYYQQRELYQAAIKRYQDVIDNYQTTQHVPEALMRLVECYLSLGLPMEAQKEAAVLGYNFPGSEWYQKAYNLMKENGMRQDAVSFPGVPAGRPVGMAPAPATTDAPADDSMKALPPPDSPQGGDQQDDTK